MTQESKSETGPNRFWQGPFLPLALMIVTVLVWTGFEAVQLRTQRNVLNDAKANQQPLIEQAQRIRSQLDSIAGQTAKLAEKGNPNASLIVEELRKNGITINPSAQPSGDARKN